MRAYEFIFEATTPKGMPKPLDVPGPNAVDPKGVTDPKQVTNLINQIADIAEKPTPSIKENNKNKRNKK